MANVLYQNSDQTFQVPIFDTDGITPVDANNYQFAEYNVYEAGTCNPVLTKTLASGGITINGTTFEVTIEDTDITFSTTDTQKYEHAFRPGTTAQPRLAPVFDEEVTIVEAC